MPGFPLSAIGAGIGQGVQQVDQHQAQMLARAIQQLALRRQEQEQEAQGLAGQGLLRYAQGQGGLNLPGSTMPPAGPLPGMAPPAQPQPPMPAAAPSPPLQAAADPMPTGEAARDPYPGGRDPSMDAPAPPGIPLDGPAGGARAAAAPPQPQAQPGDPAGAQASAPIPHEAPLQNPLVQQLIGPSINLRDVVQAMHEAKPDADPATLYRATSLMYEMMEKGNAAQQNTAIRAYTALMAGERLKQSGALGEERLATTRRGQDLAATGREQTSADRAAARDQRGEIAGQTSADRRRGQDLTDARGKQAATDRQAGMAQRKQQFDARLQAANSKTDRGERMQSLRAELSSIDRQLGQLRMQIPAAKPEDLKELQEQRAAVIASMNGRPVTSTPLPGGGATAPIPPQ